MIPETADKGEVTKEHGAKALARINDGPLPWQPPMHPLLSSLWNIGVRNFNKIQTQQSRMFDFDDESEDANEVTEHTNTLTQ